MKKKIVKLTKYLMPFISLFFFIWVSNIRTDGFQTDIIKRFDDSFSIYTMQKPGNIDEINKILSQEFHYFTKGHECFIFESNDHKYVLKFFNSSRYYTQFRYFVKSYFFDIPLSKFLNKSKHYNRRLNRFYLNLASVKLAWENLKEDAALVYVNLCRVDFFKSKIKLVTKNKNIFYLDVNDVFFIIQKKCDDFYQVLKDTQDDNYKNYLITSFLQMLDRRTKKLIIDSDSGEKKDNWGVYDNRVVTIDIGRWYFDEKLATESGYKKEILKGLKTLKNYLNENDPEKLKLVNEKLETYFKEFEKNSS